jgi:DmX-like protein
LDYAEITSIPPLPLWTLLAADKETVAQQQKEEVKVKKTQISLKLSL